MRGRRLSRARARRRPSRLRRRRRGSRRRNRRSRRRNRRGRNRHRSSSHWGSGRHGRSRSRRCNCSDGRCSSGRHEQRLRSIHAQRRPNTGSSSRWRLCANDDESACAAVGCRRPHASRRRRRLPDGACAAGRHVSARRTLTAQTLRRCVASHACSGGGGGASGHRRTRGPRKSALVRCAAGAQLLAARSPPTARTGVLGRRHRPHAVSRRCRDPLASNGGRTRDRPRAAQQHGVACADHHALRLHRLHRAVAALRRRGAGRGAG